MTREEAIRDLKIVFCHDCEDFECEDCIHGISIADMEKQIPKKVVKIAIPNTHYSKASTRYECPRCHKINHMYETDFCVLCGQALDWSEENG